MIVSLFFYSFLIVAQTDSTGLPGDHFSLELALDLFSQSKSLEAFERSLNEEKNHVNNLDLNQDSEIDYLKVIDLVEENVHAIVVQAIVGKDEVQDIAVIEIEKTREGEAVLQMIGDEDIYGEEIIVEPFKEEMSGRGPAESRIARLTVNVWLWPSVRFVYRPGYKIWVSPWRWGYYPRWYRPWRLHPWRWHIAQRPHVHMRFHRVSVHRVPRAHTIYTPRRHTSRTVHQHYGGQVKSYRTTNKVVHTKKTRVIEGPNGGKAKIQSNQSTLKSGNHTASASRYKVQGKTATGKTLRGKGKSQRVERKSKNGSSSVSRKKGKAKSGNKAVKATKTKRVKRN